MKEETQERIIPINIADEMRSSYIDYSMSVIIAMRNKLILRVFACVRDNRAYQKNYVHALA